MRLCVLLITDFSSSIKADIPWAARSDGTIRHLAEENIDFGIMFALFHPVLAFMASSRGRTEMDGRKDGSING